MVVTRFRTPYRAYNVLEKWDSPSWNDQTRSVVKARLDQVPVRRYLHEEQWSLLEAIVSRLVPQPDRKQPIPIAPWIDDMLFRNDTPGFRYADMPEMREAWSRGLLAIGDEARCRHGVEFEQLPPSEQDAILEDLQHGRTRSSLWGDLPPGGFFLHHLLKETVAVYYSNPAAWNEIGYGGPAGPRGYVRLGFDEHDPWEANEHGSDHA
jgi:hypothetical protein